MDEAATGLELERRIARLRTGGSDAFVSFGGARNTELASSCTDTEALKKAYASVVDRYRFTTVDLDIEGAALTDRAATNRRAVAMSALQSTKRSGGARIAVWLTLPVSPNGLSADGVAQVDAMLAAKVDLAGINAMTMDYGSSRGVGDDEWEASRKALTTMHRQVQSAYRRAGVALNAKSVWNKIGATPMIGLNDQPGETFTLAGANSLARFAVRKGMARVSIWSFNRDQQCGANSATGQVSNYCSGVTQKSAAFSGVFRRLTGSRGAGLVATRPDVVPTQSDDPAASPYPIWSENGAYPLGRKVVWHGQVYSAKWWIQGQMPDAPIVNEWDSAWHLVGPVLKGEKPVPLKVVAPGTYPEWSPQTAYAQGTKVLLGGSAYEAKWWTKGTPPDFAPAHEYDTPWKAFG